MKKCPFCAEEIQDDAVKCRYCGEMLDTDGERSPTVTDASISPSFARLLGVFMFIGGAIAAVYYFNYFDTSVEVAAVSLFGETVGGGRVNNLGLMQDRQNGLWISTFVALIGLGALLYGENASKQAGKAKGRRSTAPNGS